MKKHHTRPDAADQKARLADLTPRNAALTKGGALLQSSLSDVVKSIGDGLATMARKG